MRTIILSGILLCSGLSVHAQQAMTESTRDQFNLVYFRTPTYGMSAMSTMAGPDGLVIGTTYLDTAFAKTTVTFYKNMGNEGGTPLLAIKDAPVRYNLQSNDLEFLMDTKTVKAVGWEYVKSFQMEKAGRSVTFVNVKDVAASAEQKGFVEPLVDGKLKLLMRHELYYKRPTYNTALNTGTKDTQILKEYNCYVSDGKTLTKFSPGKKTILQLMKDKEEPITAYLKEKKPDLKAPTDLQALFSYYNEL